MPALSTSGSALAAAETAAPALAAEAAPASGIPYAAYAGETPWFSATAVPETFSTPPMAGATSSGTGVPWWQNWNTIKSTVGDALPKPTLQNAATAIVLGNAGKGLLFPERPRATGAAPTASMANNMGRYTPTSSAPAAQLANMMAQRRQAQTQRRFS